MKKIFFLLWNATRTEETHLKWNGKESKLATMKNNKSQKFIAVGGSCKEDRISEKNEH